MTEKVLVIVGPTAVGKTALSIELAQQFNGEIISGDSLQVYQQLDIGTAKATIEERAGIVHHLIDVRPLTGSFSVADFQKEAREKIADITSRGKLPIVVGGTGLYIQSLLYDFKLGAKKENEDPALAEEYETFAKYHGKDKLWEKLQAIDPLAASKIHYNNQRKVIRALIVFQQTGESIMAPKEAPALLYDPFVIGLNTAREVLYRRINQRVDLMLEQGILDEAKLLAKQPNVQAAQAIGYKEFFAYFAGQETLTEATNQLKQNSRRYAKRQLTWFHNRTKNVHWFDLVQAPEQLATIKTAVADWLESGD
jgi:tRNA dimethylallyltransferase